MVDSEVEEAGGNCNNLSRFPLSSSADLQVKTKNVITRSEDSEVDDTVEQPESLSSRAANR